MLPYNINVSIQETNFSPRPTMTDDFLKKYLSVGENAFSMSREMLTLLLVYPSSNKFTYLMFSLTNVSIWNKILYYKLE